MRRERLLLCLLATVLGGCGGCDDAPEGADTEWVSDGSGPANQEPLFPLRAGLRGSGSGTLVADSAIDSDGQRLLRVPIASTPLNTSLVVQGGLLLGQGDEGVEYHGTEYDRLARPALWVPDTVRVGMRWRVRVPGRPTTDFEVTRRSEEPSLLGPVVAWTITELAESGDAIGQLQFHEGVGLAATAYASFTPTAVALDGTLADAPLAPALEATPLTPFAVGGAEHGDNLYPMHVGLVVPAGASRATLIIKGWRSCRFSGDGGQCLEQSCFELDSSGAIGPSPPPRAESYHVGNGCVQHLVDGQLEVTSDATGALVLPGGVHWVPRNRTGSFSGAHQHPLAAYADPATGEARLLAYSGDGRHAQLRAAWGPYLPGGVNFAVTDGPLSGQWVSPLHTDTGVTGPGGDHAPVWSSTLSAPGEPVELAVLGGARTLFHSRLDGDELSPLAPVSTLTGIRSVTATETGHRLLVGSTGGHIDRVVRDPSGTLVREAIGRVALPDGERLAAAIDLGRIAPDRLLVATWRPPAADNTDPQGNFGRLAFYTTPRQAPVRWPWSAATGVVAAQRDRDVIACWPPTGAPLERTGWTLGGAAAAQVVETVPGRCALIVRDVEADPVLAGQSFAGLELDEAQARLRRLRFDVEGPVPGVGRMRLGITTTDALGDTSALGGLTVAPLAGGGYASPLRLFGEGALPTAVPPFALGDVRYPGVADAAGAGVWVAAGDSVSLIGPAPRDIALPSTVNFAAAQLADPSGGLVLQVGAAWNHYAADGTVTALPAAEAGVPWKVRRRTGELCATRGDQLFCVDSTGAETARVTVSDFVDLVALLADDSMLVSVVGPDGISRTLERWVPGSPLTPWHTLQLHSFRPALDGTAWCVLHDANVGTYQAGHCTPAGFVPVDLRPALEQRSWMVANYFRDIYSVVQGKDELWVETFGCLNGCFSRWTRLPWPP